MKIDYGGYQWNLDYFFPNNPDPTLRGLQFMSGTCIIMSQQLVQQIISNVHLIDQTVIDDVSIGKLVTRSLNINPTALNHIFLTHDYHPQIIVIRSRTDPTNPDRTADIARMKYFIEKSAICSIDHKN